MAVCLMLSLSCSKKAMEENPISNEKKIKLDFSVDRAVSTTDGQVGSQILPLKNLITQLTFVIFEGQTGAEVARQTQFSTDPNFGQLSFGLPVAQYQVVAIGSKSEFGINKFFRDNDTPVILPLQEANMQYWQPSFTMGDKQYKTDDTFFARQLITVQDPQQISMELQRIVGKLEVIVDDLENFTVDVDNEATGYMFSSESSFGNIDNDQYRISNADGPISIYILRTDKPLTIEISYGNAVSQKRRMNVPIYKNKRTIVRGKMINPVVNSFSVTINDKWLPDPELVNF